MIAYLDVQRLDPAGYLGGILVVDEFGLPLEFRHTLALRPSRLQTTLYGDALDRYLRAAVITTRLLDDLERRPAVVLVCDPLLAIGGDALPVAHMEPSGLEPSGPVGTFRAFDGVSPGFTLQLRPGDPPVRFVTKAAPSCFRSLADAVLEVAETMDVSEPPARVRAALRLIAVGESAAQAA
ncbi:MAG: hypothetical protein ABI317_02390 [Gaiellales bacterium]